MNKRFGVQSLPTQKTDWYLGLMIYDKELSSWAVVIGWNSLKKKKVFSQKLHPNALYSSCNLSNKLILKVWEARVKERQTPSSSIFLVLKSLYMTFFSELCRKARPRAAPTIILSLMFQESSSLLGFPAQPKKLLQFLFLLLNK